MNWTKTISLFGVLLLAGCNNAKSQAPDKAQVRYIANESVLVSHGNTRILFDPLPLSGFDVYAETPQEDIVKMMEGKGAYADIDAVFISHAHSDHFSAPAMLAYMNAQPNIWLIAPRKAFDLMLKEDTWLSSYADRMTILDLETSDPPQRLEIGNIKASAVRIPHAGWPAPERAAIQNIVYRVTLSDTATVIHMGDADPKRQHFIPHKEFWAEQRTDTAFPPYWFLTSSSGRYILSDEMNINKSTGVHVPLEVPDDLKESGQDYFSKSGETRVIGE